VQISASPNGPDDESTVVLAEKESLETLSAWLDAKEMAYLRQAAARDVAHFFFPRPEGPLLLRLLKGDADPNVAAENARMAGNDLLRDLRQYKIGHVALRNCCLHDHSLAVAEGLALGSYQFLKYFTKTEGRASGLQQIRLPEADAAAVAELDALLEAVFLTRDLVNEPHSQLSAVALAERCQEAGQRHGFEVESLGKPELEALQMGGLLAVNQASAAPPRFCILRWQPADSRNSRPVVLVGKGVVYDTGGLSLKPTEGMDYMKSDMAGAAAVLGAFVAAAANRLPLNLIGLLPLTDNLIGAGAFAPGDVIRMYSGTTVEVLNTDAEGRLILADALHYAKQFDPELVIDVATLTGAAVRALGNQAICYMGTAPRPVKEALEASGWATFERLVELPLWREFAEELKSNIADLKNLGSVNAGMITAGKFLEHFTGEYPWLHLDIAGPAYLRAPNSYRSKDGTGVAVRLLYDFLKKKQ
jgi:leucyl aminopeptidase